MKVYIPLKLMALAEAILLVSFAIIGVMLVQDFRENIFQQLALRAEALAQNLLQPIQALDTLTPEAFFQQEDNGVSETLIWLYETSAEQKIDRIAIIDSSGTILAHTRPQLQGTTINQKQLENLGWQQTITFSDQGTYHVFVPIQQEHHRDSTNIRPGPYLGSIDIGFSKDAVDEIVSQYFGRLLSMFVITLLVFFPLLGGVAYFMVTKPMLYLAQVGHQIARGQPIDSIHLVKYNDERAILATVFVSISKYFREITDLATKIASGSLSDKHVEKHSKRDVLGLALQDMLAYLQTVATLATKIGSGDLTMAVPLRSDRDAFGRALHQMMTSLQNMTNLATQISSGDLRGQIEPRSQRDELGYAFQSMTGYLRHLAGAATAIARGELDQDVEPKSEHDVLGNAFHTMAVRLRENFEQIQQEVEERTRAQEALQELNEELEQRVQDRTLELATAYEEIQLLNERLQEENLRMGAELDVARRLQTMILPPPEELESIEHVDIVGYMQPADEVGGDYYDVLKQNGSIHIGIGDVTGHGLESGVLMLMTQTAVRTLVDHGETDPKIFLNTLNRVLFQNIQRMGVDRSLSFSILNYQQNALNIIGQHEELLVVRQNGHVERVDTMELGFPLGLVDDIGEWVSEATIDLQPGDGIVLYTDGITEAENDDGQHYGLERLCDSISQHWQNPSDQVRQLVIKDVMHYIGEHKVYDDITLVVLKQK